MPNFFNNSFFKSKDIKVLNDFKLLITFFVLGLKVTITLFKLYWLERFVSLLKIALCPRCKPSKLPKDNTEEIRVFLS